MLLCDTGVLLAAGGQLEPGPVKTRAAKRDLPIVTLARTAFLARQANQATDRDGFGRAWQDTGLVFTTRSGLPVEPRNLVRSFRRICGDHGIRVITVHHLRHTTASLLKKLHVPPRDAQMILGHAQFSTTMQIYTHVDEEARNEALAGLNELLNSRRLISALRSEMVVSGLGSVDRANDTPGGAKGTRTPDPLLAKIVRFVLSQVAEVLVAADLPVRVEDRD
jgi:hypothetical protein